MSGLERENRRLGLENFHLRTAMERSARYNLSKDRLIEVVTADLVKAKEDLQAANDAMKELVAGISHDLRTPLTIMSVNLEELAEIAREGGNGELLAKAEAAWRKNLDLQRITQNLFEVSRIEAGRSAYDLRWFPLPELMLALRERYGNFLEDQGLYLDTSYSTCGEEVDLWLDKQKIWGVFDNIVYNAARYTTNGGITISAAATGEIEVRDTGTGIAAEHLPHIFERFYKVPAAPGAPGTLSTESGNSGLGLYIVKSLMQAFGGDATAKSTPGQGTSVILTFKRRA